MSLSKKMKATLALSFCMLASGCNEPDSDSSKLQESVKLQCKSNDGTRFGGAAISSKGLGKIELQDENLSIPKSESKTILSISAHFKNEKAAGFVEKFCKSGDLGNTEDIIDISKRLTQYSQVNSEATRAVSTGYEPFIKKYRTSYFEIGQGEKPLSLLLSNQEEKPNLQSAQKFLKSGTISPMYE